MKINHETSYKLELSEYELEMLKASMEFIEARFPDKELRQFVQQFLDSLDEEKAKNGN